jgi:hypothetical protein
MDVRAVATAAANGVELTSEGIIPNWVPADHHVPEWARDLPSESFEPIDASHPRRTRPEPAHLSVTVIARIFGDPTPVIAQRVLGLNGEDRWIAVEDGGLTIRNVVGWSPLPE